MAEEVTVEQAFGMAIAAEQAAEELYIGLAQKFRHQPEIATFWKEYAAEEVEHARWLERLLSGLSAEQRHAPADPQIVKELRRLLGFSVSRALEKVHDLEDAYQLVHKVENSETNAVFEFLILNFSDPASQKEAHDFIRTQLQYHVDRVATDFPLQFDSVESRQSVRVSG